MARAQKVESVEAVAVDQVVAVEQVADEVAVKVKETITAEHIEAVNKMTTKSAKIRSLDSFGYKRGTIATFLGIRYQHVRNVLTQPLKKV